MKIKSVFLKIAYFLKETTTEIHNDNALKLRAALSYYTIFSFPLLLILIISLLGFFRNRGRTR